LVDIFMPELDGLEGHPRAAGRGPSSENRRDLGRGRTGTISLLQAAAALGASGTLSKPFEPHALLTAVRELLEMGAPS